MRAPRGIGRAANGPRARCARYRAGRRRNDFGRNSRSRYRGGERGHAEADGAIRAGDLEVCRARWHSRGDRGSPGETPLPIDRWSSRTAQSPRLDLPGAGGQLDAGGRLDSNPRLACTSAGTASVDTPCPRAQARERLCVLDRLLQRRVADVAGRRRAAAPADPHGEARRTPSSAAAGQERICREPRDANTPHSSPFTTASSAVTYRGPSA